MANSPFTLILAQGSLLRPSHGAPESRTCDDVPDGLHQCREARDFGLPVLPHGLPYNKAAGQSEREVGFLGGEKIYVHKVASKNGWKGQSMQGLTSFTGLFSKWVDLPDLSPHR